MKLHGKMIQLASMRGISWHVVFVIMKTKPSVEMQQASQGIRKISQFTKKLRPK